MNKRATDRSPVDGTITVVVPTYNEAESIASLVERVLALGAWYRILVVDDSSPDGTATVVRSIATARRQSQASASSSPASLLRRER